MDLDDVKAVLAKFNAVLWRYSDSRYHFWLGGKKYKVRHIIYQDLVRPHSNKLITEVYLNSQKMKSIKDFESYILDSVIG